METTICSKDLSNELFEEFMFLSKMQRREILFSEKLEDKFDILKDFVFDMSDIDITWEKIDDLEVIWKFLKVGNPKENLQI